MGHVDADLALGPLDQILQLNAEVALRRGVVSSSTEDLDILWFVVSVDVPDLAPKVWAILADIARPEGKIDT